MSSTFTLQLFAADRPFYNGKVHMVILPAIDGEKAVMANHEEMVIAIKEGVVRYQLEDETWHKAVVSDGFADVANNRLKILVYSCERPEDIDLKRAQEAKERAEEQLRQKQSIQEYHVSKASLARALVRISEASLGHNPRGY